MKKPLNVFIVVGEHSGDQLGFKLMRALKVRLGEAGLRFHGVGGEAMEAEGLKSLFPLHDIAVMGILPVIRRLPTLLARIKTTTDAVIANPPDGLVIIDSPDFTHRVAARARRILPDLPIIDYVSPSVWAWRPGRARKMRAYIDEVLALLPFEPEAHERLGGPSCHYVGHPLIERLDDLRPQTREEQAARQGEPARLLVLPGSRRSEISRLLGPFGETVNQVVQQAGGPVEVVLPALTHLADEIRAATAAWPVQPSIVLGEAQKLAAFRRARAALAASGTVTLELALAGVPMVVAYRVSKLEEQLKYVIKVSSMVLPNLILGTNIVPEWIQGDVTPARLVPGLLPLLHDTPERRAQLAAFARLDGLMAIGSDTPSERAARLVLETIERRKLSAG
jgi:lipid-A-disaccharide synthase